MKGYLLTWLLLVPILIPAIAFASLDSDVHYGSTGQDVTALQEFLTQQGLYAGPVSGNFYSLTLAAVKKFQSAEGITPISGYVGPVTRGVINQILAGQVSSSEGNATTTGPVTDLSKQTPTGTPSHTPKTIALPNGATILLNSDGTFASYTPPPSTPQQTPAQPAPSTPTASTPATSAVASTPPSTPITASTQTPPLTCTLVASQTTDLSQVIMANVAWTSTGATSGKLLRDSYNSNTRGFTLVMNDDLSKDGYINGKPLGNTLAKGTEIEGYGGAYEAIFSGPGGQVTCTTPNLVIAYSSEAPVVSKSNASPVSPLLVSQASPIYGLPILNVRSPYRGSDPLNWHDLQFSVVSSDFTSSDIVLGCSDSDQLIDPKTLANQNGNDSGWCDSELRLKLKNVHPGKIEIIVTGAGLVGRNSGDVLQATGLPIDSGVMVIQ